MEGTKIVDELLLQKRYSISELYATQEWLDAELVHSQGSRSDSPVINGSRNTDNKVEFSSNNFYPSHWAQEPKIELVSQQELKRISSLSTPNQVLAVVEMVDTTSNATSLAKMQTGWSIYLDGLQQPANLGAILRVADWFGLHHVIAGPGTVDLYNPKSLQATMGCFLRLDYQEASLVDVQTACPSLPIYAADLAGQNIQQFDAPSSGMLVIGNEGNGIRPETRELVSNYLMIPKGKGRAAESLNAAVAAGILCSWLVRG